MFEADRGSLASRGKMIDEATTQAALFQLTGVGVVQTDMATGRFVRANAAFCEMVGYSEAELLGMTNAELTHPDDWGRDAQSFRALQRGERQGGTSLTRVLCKDGSVVWLDLHVTVLGEGNGALNLMVATDVSEQKRADAVSRETEEYGRFLLRLSDALRAEPDADAVANRALRMLFEQLQLDRCYVGVYRLADDRGDFTHQVGNDRVPPVPDGVRLSDFPDALRVVFDRTLVIGDVAETEGFSDTDRRNLGALGMRALVAATLRQGENRPLWAIVAISARPRRWTRGEVALIEEVTERTWAAVERARAEAVLRKSEAKYRTLFETMGQGYCDLELLRDASGRAFDQRYLEFNPAFERLFGIPVARARGRTASEVFPGLEPWWTEAFERVAARGEPEHIEYEVASLGRWFEVLAYPRGGDRLTVLYEDITERKRVEAERERLLEELEGFNETLEQRVLERTEALRHSEQRFSQAFYVNPIPACMTTFGRETFVEVNAAFLTLTGYEHDEVVGRSSRELQMWSSPEDLKRLTEAQRDGRGFREADRHGVSGRATSHGASRHAQPAVGADLRTGGRNRRAGAL